MMGYGIARFFIEYVREPDPGLEFVIRLSQADNPPWLFVTPWNITTGQLLSLAMVVGGVGCLFLFRWLDRRKPSVETYDY
jgi:phosphatidylglycerol:prolipoprotein diacylglycerol transferase